MTDHLHRWFPAAPGRRRAFTLIEMLCVMAIFAILLSIAAAASVHWGRATRLRSSVRKAASSLDHARQWAVTYRMPTAFAPANDAGVLRGCYLITNAGQRVIGVTNYLASGIVWAGNLEPVVFLPDGCADVPGDRQFVLSETNKGARNLAVTLTVYRVTGRTRIEE